MTAARPRVAAAPADPTVARRALAHRLRAVAGVLVDPVPDRREPPEQDAAVVLSALAQALVQDPSNERVWLAVAGIAAAFPTRDEVDRVRRRIELSDPEQAAIVLLEQGMAAAGDTGSPLAEVTVVTGRVLVDVDFTARHDLHTGIQRVVRQTVPLWHIDHDILPVAWTAGRGALRPLDPVESARIHQWSADRRTDGGQDEPDRITELDNQVVIPWRCVVVLPEVPQMDVTPRIAAIGACSNNRLVAIGHDAIPLLSADTVDLEEPRKFMTYLSALKFADRIAGVSRSSAAEFAAYGSMLSSQGLPSPVTLAVPLPVEFAAPESDPTGDPRRRIRAGIGAATRGPPHRWLRPRPTRTTQPPTTRRVRRWWWWAVTTPARTIWRCCMRPRCSGSGVCGSGCPSSAVAAPTRSSCAGCGCCSTAAGPSGCAPACPTRSCGTPSRTPGSPCSRRCTRGTACRSPNRWPWAPR